MTYMTNDDKREHIENSIALLKAGEITRIRFFALMGVVKMPASECEELYLENAPIEERAHDPVHVKRAIHQKPVDRSGELDDLRKSFGDGFVSGLAPDIFKRK